MSLVPSAEESCTTAPVASPKIDGRARPRADRIVRRKFAEVARLLWEKPDAAIAVIAKCDARTGRRILRGEVDVPIEVGLAALVEMLRPME
jgi:hypothetical protein